MKSVFEMTVNGKTYEVHNGYYDGEGVVVIHDGTMTMIRENGVYANKSGIRKAIMKLDAEAQQAVEVEPEEAEEEPQVEEPVVEAQAVEEPVEAQETEQSEDKHEGGVIAWYGDLHIAWLIEKSLPKYIKKIAKSVGYENGLYGITVTLNGADVTLTNKNSKAFDKQIRVACRA